MSSYITVFKKELLNFFCSDKAVFVIYAILIFSWSMILSSNDQSQFNGGPFWLIFFSVIVTANFSNTVFISERINGSLEIFITSGVAREAILFGKVAFVFVMSTLFGGVSILISNLFRIAQIVESDSAALGFADMIMYMSATLMNIAVSAFFSVRLSNPRLLHFLNLLILVLILSVFSAGVAYVGFSPFLLIPVFILLATIFLWLANREYQGERIVRQVQL